MTRARALLRSAGIILLEVVAPIAAGILIALFLFGWVTP